MDRTSDGRSVMYDGIFFPVRNWATSLLKALQLCSNTLYLSRLGTRRKKMRVRNETDKFQRKDREARQGGEGWRAGKDKIRTSWGIREVWDLKCVSLVYLMVCFLVLLETKCIFSFYKNCGPKWKIIILTDIWGNFQDITSYNAAGYLIYAFCHTNIFIS